MTFFMTNILFILLLIVSFSSIVYLFLYNIGYVLLSCLSYEERLKVLEKFKNNDK